MHISNSVVISTMKPSPRPRHSPQHKNINQIQLLNQNSKLGSASERYCTIFEIKICATSFNVILINFIYFPSNNNFICLYGSRTSLCTCTTFLPFIHKFMNLIPLPSFCHCSIFADVSLVVCV